MALNSAARSKCPECPARGNGETFAAAVAPPDLRVFADAALGARLGQAPVGSCDPFAADPACPVCGSGHA